MTLGILAGIVLLTGVLLLVLRPLIVAGESRRALEMDEREQQLESLLFERESVLGAIRDLQMDHAMGKLSDEDFAALDASSRGRAVEVLQALDTLGAPAEARDERELERWIEEAVARARGGRAVAG